MSARAQKITSSAIREILKVTERPEVTSFAGGLPSPAAFPIERIRAASARILNDDPVAALQYGPTEGYGPLREWIAERCSRHGARVQPSQVLISSGSQQSLDLIAKVLIERDRNLLMESPTYLGALQAFALCEPRVVSIPCDESGPIPEALARAATFPASALYLLPNFQNPTGRRISEPRRREIIEVCRTRDIPIIEDDPYGELSYTGDALPSLLSMNQHGVVYAGSFSKVLAPGLRIGYVVAPEDVFRKLVHVKQASDLHTSSLTQRIVYEVVKDGFLDHHIPTIRELYAKRCNVMLDSLSESFPSGVRWNRPQGGMFIWVTLPRGMDSTVLLEQALADNIAFVPGAPFYPEAPESNTFRLSFVTVAEDQIRSGIARLGRLIAEGIRRL